MAETLGFILGEYTIPSYLPIMYITDSQNARTLQRNVKHIDSFTHRQKIRKVKQGIDHSIANHLEYLTQRWIRQEHLSAYALNLYRRAEQICDSWSSRQSMRSLKYAQYLHSPREHHNAIEAISSDDSLINSISSHEQQQNNRLPLRQDEKHRYHFDSTMIDKLDRVIILKVFSHQLNADFSIKSPGKNPSPNMFITSTNQFADNAVTQARKIIKDVPNSYEQLFYPPFSPRWCFTFDGCVTNKGATKLFYEKIDDELLARLQHREKQGLFYRLLPFIGLRADQIGNESMIRNIVKQTAMCWTRSIYRDPSMANKIWKKWTLTLPDDIRATHPATIPKDWQKHPWIAEDIIKRCPFCNAQHHNIHVGNLEHLHLYCTSQLLHDTRTHCNEKIESAIHEMYHYASLREYGVSLQDANRKTSLQEKAENAAKALEKENRLIVKQRQLITDSRQSNIAILSRRAISQAILLNQLPAEKLQEYDRYPLAFQLGCIHSLPEDKLDIAAATIIDVGYLGLLPKSILQVLIDYSYQIKRDNQDDNEFFQLRDKFVTAFVYRPITMQKVIQLMIAKEKQELEREEIDNHEATSNTENNTSATTSNTKTPHVHESQASWQSACILPPSNASHRRYECHGSKCRLLKAKGMLPRLMFCAKGKNLCSGCINELLRQKKVTQIEQDIIRDLSPNDI